MVDGFNSQAFCIALARIDTRRKASSKVRVLFATKAENSPNECPATISGFKPCVTLYKMTE